MPVARLVSNVVRLGTWRGTVRVETTAVVVAGLALGVVSMDTWRGTAPREVAAAVAAAVAVAEVVSDVVKWVIWPGIAVKTAGGMGAAAAAVVLEEILVLIVGSVGISPESALKPLDEIKLGRKKRRNSTYSLFFIFLL